MEVVGADRAGTCTFCGGGLTEAVVGCPDTDALILCQVAVCRECITDLIVTRFAAVKHQRTVALANAGRNKRDPAETRAEQLEVRGKFGLLKDTPLRAAWLYKERPERIAHWRAPK